MYTDNDHHAETARAYRRMLATLADRTSLETVARTAATLAYELLRADGATVARVVEDSAEYIAAVGTAAALMGRVMPLEGSFTGAVVQSGAALTFDPHVAPAASVGRAREDDIRSGIVCPIVVEGRVAGTIGVSSRAELAFDDIARDRLAAFAEFVSLGLERNRSHKRLERTYHFYRVGQLAGFVVDEIGKPLGRLLDALQAVRAAALELPEEVRTDVEYRVMESFNELEEISRVVHDLRTLSTDDADRVPVTLDVSQVLRRVAEYLRDRIQAVAEFEIEVPANLPRVRAVPGRIWQIAYALLVNAKEAIEARPRGVHRVRLEATFRDGNVEFSVEDDGCGIEATDLPQVFEPFFSTKTGRPRAGLGLTLVWRYVDAVGGSVDIDSTAGLGTTVRVRLPCLGERTEGWSHG